MRRAGTLMSVFVFCLIIASRNLVTARHEGLDPQRTNAYIPESNFPNSTESVDSTYHAIGVQASGEAFRSEMDTAIAVLDSILKPIDPIAIFPQLSAMGEITLPKGYVFLLIGFLAIGGVMIFIADSVRASKQIGNSVLPAKPPRKKRALKSHQVQAVFEHFVITLFDPLYFRHRKKKHQVVLSDNTTEVTAGSALQFDFNHKETHAKFGVVCQYFENSVQGEVRLFSAAGYELFREAVAHAAIPYYLVLGFGGKPDDPRELFLVPASAIEREWIRKESLQSFSKSGMFFYNNVAGRLQ